MLSLNDDNIPIVEIPAISGFLKGCGFDAPEAYESLFWLPHGTSSLGGCSVFGDEMVALLESRGAVLWTKSHWQRNLVVGAMVGGDDWNSMIRVMS